MSMLKISAGRRPYLAALATAVGLALASATVSAANLVDAAQGGDAAAVVAGLRAGADPNTKAADGTTALHWAAHNDNAELVAQLLDAGAGGVDPLQAVAGKCQDIGAEQRAWAVDQGGGARELVADRRLVLRPRRLR